MSREAPEMPLTSRSLPWSFSAFALALMSTSAVHAQTVIELTDTSQSPNPCIFTTNAGGVAADPTTGRLRATGTFGQNCQTAPAPTPAISPRLEDWALPGDWSVGVSAQVQWAASNADLCVYDGSSIPGGQAAEWPWPSSGVACNSTSSCATLHTLNLAPAVAGNYHFKLTCSYAGNAQTAVVSEIARTVSAAPTGCSAPPGWTRVTQGRLYYANAAQIGSSPITKFEHVWGQRSSAPGVFHPWPYIQGNNVGPQFGGRQYVALEFTPDRTGSFSLLGQPNDFPGGSLGISASISRNCGDFTSQPGEGSPTPTGCWFNNLQGSGGIFYSVVTGTNTCKLQLGQKYYLNMVWTTLPITSNSTSECASGNCNHRFISNCPPVVPGGPTCQVD